MTRFDPTCRRRSRCALDWLLLTPFAAAFAALLLALLLTLFGATRASAQSGTERHAGITFRPGIQATLLGTQLRPELGGENETESYITQPLVTAMAEAFGGRLSAAAMINLEGWTLEDGEMNAGAWGEGFVDRRHPHTFLHEMVATGTASFAGLDASLTLGRGFAPFGTDDPMVRPFVKYPVNHHLSQILERWIGIIALRRGPVIVEGGVFNGDEPIGPESLGRTARFGDSWAVRATVRPLDGVEVQASRAMVASPEHAHGAGLDHRKWSAAARLDRTMGGVDAYALVEWARTDEYDDDRRFFSFGTWLAEVAAARNGWRIAARWERTTRPEEERLLDPFRTARPHADENIIGVTRWITVTGRVERTISGGTVTITPFIEAARVGVREITGSIFSPNVFYGDDELWSFSLGARIGAGARHDRMGRYGVAAAAHAIH